MNQLPNVGSVVRVTTKYPESYIFAKEQFKYFTHEGTVIPSPWSTSTQTFAMTGDGVAKTRIIDLAYVDKLEFIKGSGSATANSNRARIFKVTSKSKGKSYNVVFNNGSIMCDCVGFQYRKNCRHSKGVKDYIKMEKI